MAQRFNGEYPLVSIDNQGQVQSSPMWPAVVEKARAASRLSEVARVAFDAIVVAGVLGKDVASATYPLFEGIMPPLNDEEWQQVHDANRAVQGSSQLVIQAAIDGWQLSTPERSSQI